MNSRIENTIEAIEECTNDMAVDDCDLFDMVCAYEGRNGPFSAWKEHNNHLADLVNWMETWI